MTRDCGLSGVPFDSLSKIRSVALPVDTGLCCQANGTPGPGSKSLRLPPSRQMMRPVSRSTS